MGLSEVKTSTPNIENVNPVHFCTWHECEVLTGSEFVCFSNRPFGVKHFQTIHHSVDVTRGLVLLFGIGTKALVWGFRCQGVRQGGEAFLRRFLGSISKPVSSSRPA